MKLGQLFVAVCVVAIVIPTTLLCLQRRYIDLNGVTLTLVEVFMQTVTRQQVDFYEPPNPQQSPELNQQPQPENKGL